MKMFKQGLLHAALALAYITLIGTVVSNNEHRFDSLPKIFIPIYVLSMLVVSAAVMGMLIFGKPVMLYIDGKKREAITLVISTIGSLAALTVLFLAILAARYR